MEKSKITHLVGRAPEQLLVSPGSPLDRAGYPWGTREVASYPVERTLAAKYRNTHLTLPSATETHMH